MLKEEAEEEDVNAFCIVFNFMYNVLLIYTLENINVIDYFLKIQRNIVDIKL